MGPSPTTVRIRFDTECGNCYCHYTVAVSYSSESSNCSMLQEYKLHNTANERAAFILVYLMYSLSIGYALLWICEVCTVC